MRIRILGDQNGQPDIHGRIVWEWDDSAGDMFPSWLFREDSVRLLPEEMGLEVSTCDGCERTNCAACGRVLLHNHRTIGAFDSPVSEATCGYNPCNTLIANMISPAEV